MQSSFNLCHTSESNRLDCLRVNMPRREVEFDEAVFDFYNIVPDDRGIVKGNEK